jgi:hypothetical protein
MMKETDLQYVVRQLGDRKGRWLAISIDTRVAYSTVRAIANGDNFNPMLKTLNKLVQYFKGRK